MDILICKAYTTAVVISLLVVLIILQILEILGGNNGKRK